MATHSEIAHAFANGKGPKKGSHVYREPHINGKIDVIYSYGTHFAIAVRNDDDKLFLINGDRYGVTTSRHQSIVRGAIANRNEYRDYKTLTVPFTIINRVYGTLWSRLRVNIIDVGREREFSYCFTCDQHFPDWNTLQQHRWDVDGHKTKYFHQLAPSTFSINYFGDEGPAYFISGFDETANGNTDGYFLSQLPAKPRNIAHAFEMLKPREVKQAEKNGLKILRQGDIFAIPTDLDTRRLKKHGDYYKVGLEDHYYWGTVYKRQEYPRLLETSHVATEVVVNKNKVYARGVLRHRPTEFGRAAPEHINITIGKKWHRIVRNTALASYSLGGRVD